MFYLEFGNMWSEMEMVKLCQFELGVMLYNELYQNILEVLINSFDMLHVQCYILIMRGLKWPNKLIWNTYNIINNIIFWFIGMILLDERTLTNLLITRILNGKSL